jgi:hypothetical protein
MSEKEREEKKILLGGVLSSVDFKVETESEWDIIFEHIEVHKYFLDRKLKWKVDWNDVLFSWYENVFMPIMRILYHRSVKKAFPGKSLSQLYFDISTHWYYMLEKDPRKSEIDAAYDYISRYGKGLSKVRALFALPLAA